MRRLFFIVGLALSLERTFAMDLKDVESFTVQTMPVILKSTTAFGDITAFELTFYGTVTVPPKPGLVELLTGTLHAGTKSYSKEQIDHILTEKGAAFSIDARSDVIEVSLKCLKKFLPDLLPLVSEMLQSPRLLPEEVEITRSQMMNHLKGEQDHPDSLLQLISSQAFYKDHPYSNRPSGYLETVESIKREELAALLPKLFNKGNALITVVGNISKPEAEQLVEKYFGSLPRGEKASLVMALPRNKPGELVFRKMDSPTTYFLAKFKAPSLMNPDYPALVLISEILSQRLFEEVRTKRALTYAVSAGLGNSGINSGYLYVTSTQIKDATKVIFDEIRKIQTSLVDAEDLQLQIRKFTSNWYLGREQASSQATILALYESIGHGWQNSDTFLKRLSNVTSEQMREVAKKYFKDFTYAVVGPEKPQLNLPGIEIDSKTKASKPKSK